MSHQVIVTVTAPSVPFGPDGVEPRVADADYYRSAARNIRFQASRGNPFSGSNVTETVARLCDSVAAALSIDRGEGAGVTESEWWVLGHPGWPDGIDFPTPAQAEKFYREQPLVDGTHDGVYIRRRDVTRYEKYVPEPVAEVEQHRPARAGGAS